jgi:uncharacterized membrane protein YeaQ/YmgE (transglycosylase-associated protein family)
MGIISWIVMGGLAGWVASMITGRNQNMGLIANIVVGVVGGLLGGWIASLLGLGAISGFNLGSFLIALGGACLLLFVTGMFKRK